MRNKDDHSGYILISFALFLPTMLAFLIFVQTDVHLQLFTEKQVEVCRRELIDRTDEAVQVANFLVALNPYVKALHGIKILTMIAAPLLVAFPVALAVVRGLSLAATWGKKALNQVQKSARGALKLLKANVAGLVFKIPKRTQTFMSTEIERGWALPPFLPTLVKKAPGLGGPHLHHHTLKKGDSSRLFSAWRNEVLLSHSQFSNTRRESLWRNADGCMVEILRKKNGDLAVQLKEEPYTLSSSLWEQYL